MRSLFARSLRSANDRMRYSETVRAAAAMGFRTAIRLRDLNPIQKARYAIRQARLSYGTSREDFALRLLKKSIEQLDVGGLAWSEAFPGSDSPIVNNALILKPPVSGKERGVLVVAFEEEWIKLFRHADISALAADYDLVLSPTWSPPFELAMPIASRIWPRKLVTMLSNIRDAAVFPAFLHNVEVARLLASSWIHPDLWRLDECPTKTIDMTVVANFAQYKRHFALLRLLAKSRNIRKVVLAGVPHQNRTKETLLREARDYGVEDRIEVRVSLTDHELRAAVQSSRIAAIGSLNEGSCISIAEAIMADVPVAIFRNAHIGSKMFVNDETGVLLDRKSGGTILDSLYERSPSMTPRTWMLQHGHDCFRSTTVLQEAVKAMRSRERSRFEGKLAVHAVVRLAPTFVRQEDAELAARFHEEFPAKYGVQLNGGRIPMIQSI